MFAKALWATGLPRALGAAGEPCVPSIVSLVTLVHWERSPLEKSSAKMSEATWIGADAGLIELTLFTASTASTV